MTALIYITNIEFIYVLMDTLCLRGDSKKPYNYSSKIYLLPHLKTIMCCTGQSDIARDWYNFIQYYVIAKDFNYLNRITTQSLINIWKRYKWKPESSSTVYHFGYDETNKNFAGYAFRSKQNFKIEKLDYGIGVKPEIPDLKETLNNKNAQSEPIKALIEIIKEMKEIDSKKEISEILGIGGEIQLAKFENPNTIQLHIVHRFDDFEQKFHKMLIEGQKQNLEQIISDYFKIYKL